MNDTTEVTRTDIDAARKDYNSTMARLRASDPSAALVLFVYRQRAIDAEDRLHRVREVLEERSNRHE